MIELKPGWLRDEMLRAGHMVALEEMARADANLASARVAAKKVVDEAEARVARARARLTEAEAELREHGNG